MTFPCDFRRYLMDLNVYDHLTYLGFPFTENYLHCAMLT
jgi:hypothetical protein